MASLLSVAYEICPLADLPPVFAEPELAVLYADLAPGQSQEVSSYFLRLAAPWPSLDIGGPGSSGPGSSGDGRRPKAEEPRAVFLLHPDSPVLVGPLIIVAPALLLHSLTPVADGGLPRDTWTIAEGPYAPTVYGAARSSGDGNSPILFAAYPQSGQHRTFTTQDREALVGALADYFIDVDLRSKTDGWNK